MADKIGSFVKGGLQGGTGTGKTTTTALELLGLSVERHDKAPVLVFDTEPGWQFAEEFYRIEGVKLHIRNGRHFKGLTDALAEAKQLNCCGFAVDSLTHPWTELLQRFAGADGRVPMHKFNQIKAMWNAYVVDFMDSPIHAFACGRLQWEMITTVDDEGGYDVVRGDSKMKAGGGESFGYEPHLLLEMRHEQKRGPQGQKAGQGGRRRAAGTGMISGLEYVGFVLKDRSRALNGAELRFQDFREYKPGGYRAVYQSFLPHITKLESIAAGKLGSATSASIIPGGNSEFYRTQQARKIELEEIEGSIASLWPGQDAKSKKIKGSIVFVLFDTRSWSKVEELPLSQLELAHQALKVFEKELEGSLCQMPKDDEASILSAIGQIHDTLLKERQQSSLPGLAPAAAGEEGGAVPPDGPPSDLFAGEEIGASPV